MVPLQILQKIVRNYCMINSMIFFTLSCTSQRVRVMESKLDRSRDSFIAKGTKGMIAAAHPLASKAGLRALKMGGNAIDAMVAASFVVSVVRPQSTGIGGGGFMLYYNHSKRKTEVYDFRERAPLAASKDMYLDPQSKEVLDFEYKGTKIPKASLNGHLSVAVPGLVAGLLDAHDAYGILPLKELMIDAINIAKNGFKVYPSLSRAIKFRAKILQHFEGSRSLFMPKGKALEAGDILVQSDLAQTLNLIAQHGKDGFYKGEVAKKIIEEMKHGGIISQKDLDSYQVKKRKPLVGTYRNHRIVSMPPPSSGGAHIIQILNILSHDNMAQWQHDDPRRLHLLAEAMRRSYADRAKYLGDPDFVEVPIHGLTSLQYATKLRKTINSQKASSSKDISHGNPLPFESNSTTHISVVDQWGNAVSTTQTINFAFGSGVIARGTGIVLNDEMDDFSIKTGSPNAFGLVGGKANAVAAKKTMLSSMSPTLVFDHLGKLKLILGSPGGSRIITATLQTILNTIDHKMPLKDAVHSFRIHNQWLPDEIRIERNGLLPKTKLTLESMGHQIKSYSFNIGDVQAIAKENNQWVGVSDTRSDGVPMGY